MASGWCLGHYPRVRPEWRTGWGSKVQGAKAAPGWHQTGVRHPAQATNLVQPRAVVPTRAVANRNRERASDRPGLGICGQKGGVSANDTRL